MLSWSQLPTLHLGSKPAKSRWAGSVSAVQSVTAELESEDELKLNVVLADGAVLTPEDICRFINDNAPYFFVPRYIEFVAALPYTPTNKIQKYRLRKQGISPETWDRKRTDFQLER